MKDFTERLMQNISKENQKKIDNTSTNTLRASPTMGEAGMVQKQNVETHREKAFPVFDKKKDMNGLVMPITEYIMYQYFVPIVELEELSKGKKRLYGGEKKYLELSKEEVGALENIIGYYKKNETGSENMIAVTNLKILINSSKSEQAVKLLKIVFDQTVISATNARLDIVNTFNYLQSELKNFIEEHVVKQIDTCNIEEDRSFLYISLRSPTDENDFKIKYDRKKTHSENYTAIKEKIYEIVDKVIEQWDIKQHQKELDNKKRASTLNFLKKDMGDYNKYEETPEMPSEQKIAPK